MTAWQAVLIGVGLGLAYIFGVISLVHHHFCGHWRFWIFKRKSELRPPSAGEQVRHCCKTRHCCRDNSCRRGEA